MSDDQKFKFQLYRRGNFGKPPGTSWVVPGLLVRRGITLVYGEPKKGKSMALHSIACVATAEYATEAERLWCGFKVPKLKIAYIVLEGFNGTLARHDSWENINRVRISDDLVYLRKPCNFFGLSATRWGQPVSDVEVLLRELEAQDFEPNYFIVDTMSHSMAGGKENSPEDMTRVFEQAQILVDRRNAGLAFSAHSTKDGENFRGTGAIFASVDGMIECRSDRPLQITLTPIAFKDAAAGDPVTVQCETSTVDTEEGSQEFPMVNCRADPLEEPLAGKSEGKSMSDTDVVVEAVVRVLAWQFPGEAVRRTDLHKAVETDLGREVDPTVMNRALEKMKKAGAAGQVGERGPYRLLVQPGSDEWAVVRNKLGGVSGLKSGVSGVSDKVTLGSLTGTQRVSIVTDTPNLTSMTVSPTSGCNGPVPVVSEADEALAATLEEAMATIRKLH
jgi:hypothetical protein